MPTSSIAIVGAGPRGTGVLERLAASAPELHPDGIDVHLVDPFPAGAGRIWRHEQSPLLAMNSMAADVTMYTDDSVLCDGPIVAGPSFWEWAQTGPVVDPDLVDELARVTAATFPSRRLQSAYLGWVLRDVIARLPAGMRVHLHRTRATGLTEDGDTQILHLENGPPLRVDAVVLASGHLDATPTSDELDLAARAAAAGLRYLPPEQTTDTDLSVIAPGEPVLVRGLGLAFIDLVVLLFEGRGGRFERAGSSTDGLLYVPSGEEPYLLAGSPRGAPYHSKTHYQLRAGRPQLPRFFGPEQIDPLIAAGGPVDMVAQVWPSMAKEIAWGWYHELFVGHPDRVAVPWPEFASRFATLRWGPELDALIVEAVPDPLDRLDLAKLDRPLEGIQADSLDALQPLVRAQIAEDLRQHVDERHTPHLGAFVAMLSVYSELARLSGVLSTRSRAVDMGWWQGFFNGVASGPPGFRVRQLLALARAGYVRFLGPGMRVDIADGVFRATSSAIPDVVTTRVLVDARLPDPSASRSSDPLVAALMRHGAASEEVLRDEHGAVLRNTGQLRVRPADGALVDAAGRPHPRRFAVGPHTTVKVAGAFTRPGMNAQSLRYNDAVARAVLRTLSAAPERAAA
ncbi:MAG TPA: FAD/NAD(P)-binding protein [Pseudonocardia sp.]